MKRISSRPSSISPRPLAAGVLFLGLLVWLWAAPSAQAQEDQTCDPPVYYGIQHCSHDGGRTHVVVVDLWSSRVRVQTVMAAYQQDGQELECAGVNVPSRSTPGIGCSVPGNRGLFPGQPVLDMANRYLAQGAVAAINGDYMAANQTHGPEGFTVRNGVRYDGWLNGDCDGAPWYNLDAPNVCHANDISRPSLALSKRNQPDLSWKTPGDLDNARLYGYRFYNAIGGGPMLVTNGQPIADSARACRAEDFPADVCTKRTQSAVGVTGDLRYLVMVTTSARPAAQVAELMASPVYGVTTAMKLDGGGSSQMWVRQGDQGLYYYITNNEFDARQVTVPVGQSVTDAIRPYDWPRPIAQSLMIFSDKIGTVTDAAMLRPRRPGSLPTAH